MTNPILCCYKIKTIGNTRQNPIFGENLPSEYIVYVKGNDECYIRCTKKSNVGEYCALRNAIKSMGAIPISDPMCKELNVNDPDVVVYVCDIQSRGSIQGVVIQNNPNDSMRISLPFTNKKIPESATSDMIEFCMTGKLSSRTTIPVEWAIWNVNLDVIWMIMADKEIIKEYRGLLPLVHVLKRAYMEKPNDVITCKLNFVK